MLFFVVAESCPVASVHEVFRLRASVQGHRVPVRVLLVRRTAHERVVALSSFPSTVSGCGPTPGSAGSVGLCTCVCGAGLGSWGAERLSVFAWTPALEEGTALSPPSPGCVPCRPAKDGLSDRCQVVAGRVWICISLLRSHGDLFLWGSSPCVYVVSCDASSGLWTLLDGVLLVGMGLGRVVWVLEPVDWKAQPALGFGTRRTCLRWVEQGRR